MRSRGIRSRSTTSFAVYSAFVNTTSQLAAARAVAGASRRDHPIREMQHVRVTEEPLRRWTPQPAPGCANRVSKWHRRDVPLDRKVRQSLVEQLPPANADRTEGDQLLRSVRRLHHPPQSAEDVVADARPRMRERRDVIRDPHGAA